MGEEELIGQVGLLLTQTRFARRALEDIERATSAYGTFAFTSVVAAGARFGEPPMFNGALKVHVINIGDLAPGGGFGALIEGLLGGAGAFVGNLFGGAVGGAAMTAFIIRALPTIDSIAARVERILALLGIGQTTAETKDARGAPTGGSSLATQLESIERAVNGLTGLFTAASRGPDEAAGVSRLATTSEGARWKALLDSATGTLGAVSRVVDGLIIALPIALGSIAALIVRLGDIRLAIAETLQFLLRNALLLRGALTVTLFDTLALLARMAARVVEVLSTTLAGMIGVLFDTVREVLLAVLGLGAVLGDAIKTTIDKLLNWIVPTLDVVLRNFADLRAFRVLTHVVRILPAILPPIFELANDTPLGATQAKDLADAAKLPFLDVVGPGGTIPPPAPVTPPPAPDFARAFSDPAFLNRLGIPLDRIDQVTKDGLRIAGDTAQQGLQNLATGLDRAAVAESQLSSSTLDDHLAEVRRRSTELAENLVVGEKVKPETGLEAIARAYESWLSEKNGLTALLSTITRHFASAEGQTGVPQRIVEGTLDRPLATIQIDEVVVLVEPGAEATEAPPSEFGPGDFPLPPEGDDIERYARMWRDFERRGGRRRMLPRLA